MSKILSKIKKKELLERKIGGKKKQNRLRPTPDASTSILTVVSRKAKKIQCKYIHKNKKHTTTVGL